MELSLSKCKSILETLPIGFYTGRRIEVELDAEAETSYYMPMEDKIKVSYPIIAHRMSKVKEGDCDEDEAVRSMLYHEVSHAILTPEEGLHNNETVNTFEDERIETVLRNYYHGVNFKKQLLDIHGGHVPKAHDNRTAFFNAVRFGLGTRKVRSEVKRLLEKYKMLNRASNRWDSDPCCSDYEDDISRLYKLICNEFEEDPDAFNGDGNNDVQQMDSLKNSSGPSEDGDEEGDQENENEQSSTDGQQSIQEHKVQLDVEQVKRMVGQSLSHGAKLTPENQQKLNDFQKTVETIIGNFNKKNAGGCGINTYSGVFNPRAVARKDYRYFERSMTTQGNNKFGSCHLNLLIDCSGSFYDNVDLTNGILATLSEVERKNRNFTMDVCFINDGLHPCRTVKDRQMEACGSNTIPPETKQLLVKWQKPQTCNYNIILFDGDAICDWSLKDETKRKMFGIFDMKQTTLITDPDNEKYMKPAFTSTKVIVTKHYTDELINHITNALTIAFG